MSVAGHHLPIWFDEAIGPDDGDVSVWNSAAGRFESAPVVGGAIPPGTYARVEEFDARDYLSPSLTPATATAAQATAAIQAAVNAAEAASGTAVISKGTWLGLRIVDATTDAGAYCVRCDSSNTRIRVEGTFKLADGQLSAGLGCNIIQVGNGTDAISNVRVDGPGTVDGNRANNPSVMPVSSQAGVRIEGPVTDSWVEGVTVINTRGDAIHTAGRTGGRAARVHVNRNTVRTCSEGILVSSADVYEIVGNSIIGTVEQDPIEPIRATDGLIAYNYIDGGPQHIDIFSGVERCVVIGNILRNCAGIGITDTAEDVRDILITDNFLDTCTNGIQVAGPTADVERVLVTGNKLINCGGGVIFGSPVGAGTIYDVAAIGNHVFDADGWGITSFPDDAVIRDNIVRNCNSSATAGVGGIQIRGARSRAVGNSVIDDRATKKHEFAIEAFTGANSTIIDNSVSGVIGGGELVSSTVGAGTIVRNNPGTGDDISNVFTVNVLTATTATIATSLTMTGWIRNLAARLSLGSVNGLEFTDLSGNPLLVVNSDGSVGAVVSNFNTYANGMGYVARSPDGTAYKLVAPNGGGAASWVPA